jgi:hypothetical protein
MRYQVPQFIEVEDKIFGPLTLKQFIYLAGGGGVCLIFFTLLPIYVALILSAPVAGFAAAMAFYQVNGRPFIVVMEHAFMYLVGKKLYLWKQREAKAFTPSVAPAAAPTQTVPKLSESRLKDLAWSLNIKDRSVMGEGEQKRSDFAV